MENNKKEYKSPLLTLSKTEFEDLLLVSIVEGGNDIFDFEIKPMKYIDDGWIEPRQKGGRI